MNISKDDVAQLLANSHRQAEPNITKIIRILGAAESESREPIKLLEVNPKTPPSGILPIVFTPDPPEILFPSAVVEVTPDELTLIMEGELNLPNGWKLGPTLF